eukprot:366441-Chlamydomonas_euryale.AAC.6
MNSAAASAMRLRMYPRVDCLAESGAKGEGHTPAGRGAHTSGCDCVTQGRGPHTSGCDCVTQGRGAHTSGCDCATQGRGAHTSGCDCATQGQQEPGYNGNAAALQMLCRWWVARQDAGECAWLGLAHELALTACTLSLGMHACSIEPASLW